MSSTPRRGGRGRGNAAGHRSVRFASPQTAQRGGGSAAAGGRGGNRTRGSQSFGRGGQHSNSPNAQRPNAPREPTCQTTGAVEERFQALKNLRERERTNAIAQGVLADPTKRRTLAEAITPVGTCPDMCPEFERVERMRAKDVWAQEMKPASLALGRDGYQPSEARMVKKFKRAAAGDAEQLPSDLRPPPTLQHTVDFLFNTVIREAKSLGNVHTFVWDRTRAVRNDFSIQQLSKAPDIRIAMDCYERIARFHILSLHQLSGDEEIHEGYDWYQDREQLDRTLLSLVQFYDDHRGLVESANEPEFRAYCIIFQIQNPVPDLEERVQSWPSRILKHHSVATALKLYAAAGNTHDRQGPLKPRTFHAIAQEHWQRFWRIIQSNEVSYLMACVAELYFNLVRRTALNAIWQAYRQNKNIRNDDWTLEALINVLGLDDPDDVMAFCERFGFSQVLRDDGRLCLDLSSVKGSDLPNPEPSLPEQQLSYRLVEAKRRGRTLPAVINGMTVGGATRQGQIDTSTPLAVTETMSDEEEDNSIFVPDSNKTKGHAHSNSLDSASESETEKRAPAVQNPFAQPPSILKQPSQSSSPFSGFTSSNPFAPKSDSSTTSNASVGFNPFAPKSDTSTAANTNANAGFNPFAAVTKPTTATPPSQPTAATAASAGSPFAPSTLSPAAGTFTPASQPPIAAPQTASPFSGFSAKGSSTFGANTAFPAPQPSSTSASASAASEQKGFSALTPSPFPAPATSASSPFPPFTPSAFPASSTSSTSPFPAFTSSPPSSDAQKKENEPFPSFEPATSSQAAGQQSLPAFTSPFSSSSQAGGQQPLPALSPSNPFSGFSPAIATPQKPAAGSSADASTTTTKGTSFFSTPLQPTKETPSDQLYPNLPAFGHGNGTSTPSNVQNEEKPASTPKATDPHDSSTASSTPKTSPPSTSTKPKDHHPSRPSPLSQMALPPTASSDTSAFPAFTSTAPSKPASRSAASNTDLKPLSPSSASTAPPVKPPAPTRPPIDKERIFNRLAHEVLLDPSTGFLRQFLEYTIEKPMRQTLDLFAVEVQHGIAKDFRRKHLAQKYGMRWRNKWRKRKLVQQGRARRQRRAATASQFHKSINFSDETNRRPEPNRVEVNGSTALANGTTAVSTKQQPVQAPELRLDESFIIPPAPARSSLNEHLFKIPSKPTDSRRSSFSSSNYSMTSNHKRSTTQGSYFRLKALGISPNPGGNNNSSSARKRLRDVSGATPYASNGTAPDAKRPLTESRMRSNSPNMALHDIGQGPSRPASAVTVSPPDSVATTSTTAVASSSPQDDALFARVRAARLAMADSIAFYRAERERDDAMQERRRSSGGVGVGQTNGSSPQSIASTPRRESGSAARALPAYRYRSSAFIAPEEYGREGYEKRIAARNSASVNGSVDGSRNVSGNATPTRDFAVGAPTATSTIFAVPPAMPVKPTVPVIPVAEAIEILSSSSEAEEAEAEDEGDVDADVEDEVDAQIEDEDEDGIDADDESDDRFDAALDAAIDDASGEEDVEGEEYEEEEEVYDNAAVQRMVSLGKAAVANQGSLLHRDIPGAKHPPGSSAEDEDEGLEDEEEEDYDEGDYDDEDAEADGDAAMHDSHFRDAWGNTGSTAADALELSD